MTLCCLPGLPSHTYDDRRRSPFDHHMFPMHICELHCACLPLASLTAALTAVLCPVYNTAQNSGQT